MKLTITSRAGAMHAMADPNTEFTHIVSIGANGRTQTAPKGFKKYAAKKLRLEFFDISVAQRKNMNGPSEKDVKQLIEFLQEVVLEKDINILIHCWQGVRRSTAAGLIFLEMFYQDKEKAREELYKLVPKAWPNGRMMDLANKILKDVD